MYRLPRGCSAAPSRLNSGFEAALEHPHAGGVLGGDLLEHLLEEGRVGAVGLEVRHQLLRVGHPDEHYRAILYPQPEHRPCQQWQEGPLCL